MKQIFVIILFAFLFLSCLYRVELVAKTLRQEEQTDITTSEEVLGPGSVTVRLNRLLMLKNSRYVFQSSLERFRGVYAIADTPETFRKVIEGMENVNEKDDYGMTLLHYAVRAKENLEHVRILLQRGAEVDAKTENGETPLFFARDPDMIRLLKEYKADFTAKNQQGKTVLHFLANRNVPVTWKNNDRTPQPLHPATKETYILLTESGADIDAKDESLDTPLHTAAKDGILPSVLDYLLEKGASLNAKNLNEETPFHILALRKNYAAGIKTLLRYGPDTSGKWRFGITPLHRHVAFSDDNELIEMLLQHGFEVNVKDEFGVTPLQLAVYFSRSPELIKLLIQRGADTSVVDKSGNTLLHWVARKHENDSIAKILLEAGMNLDAVNEFQSTALHELFLPSPSTQCKELFGRHETRREYEYMQQYDHFRTGKETPIPILTNPQKQQILELELTNRKNLPILHAFVEHGCDLNIAKKNRKNMTALMLALNYQRPVEYIAFLVKHGADLSAKDSDGNNTIAHFARTPEHFRFLAENRFDFNSRNNDGETCFMTVLRLNIGHKIVPGQMETFEILAKNGYDFDIGDQTGETPLQIAAGRYDLDMEMIKKLLQHTKDLKQTNARGETLLHIAARNLNPVLAKLFLDRGVDLRKCDNEGNSPLHAAVASYGNTRTVKFLIDSGIDVNMKNKKGETPLFATFTQGDGMTEFLVAQGADVHARDSRGNTVLHALTGSHSLKKIVFLVERGVDVNAKNNDGYTALHLAARGGTSASLKALLESGADPEIETKDGETVYDLNNGPNAEIRQQKYETLREFKRKKQSKTSENKVNKR